MKALLWTAEILLIVWALLRIAVRWSDISTPIDCLLGLAVAVSVGLAAWTIWRSRDR